MPLDNISWWLTVVCCSQENQELKLLRKDIYDACHDCPQAQEGTVIRDYRQIDCQSACLQRHIWRRCGCLDITLVLPFFERRLLCGWVFFFLPPWMELYQSPNVKASGAAHCFSRTKTCALCCLLTASALRRKWRTKASSFKIFGTVIPVIILHWESLCAVLFLALGRKWRTEVSSQNHSILVVPCFRYSEESREALVFPKRHGVEHCFGAENMTSVPECRTLFNKLFTDLACMRRVKSWHNTNDSKMYDCRYVCSLRQYTVQNALVWDETLSSKRWSSLNSVRQNNKNNVPW